MVVSLRLQLAEALDSPGYSTSTFTGPLPLPFLQSSLLFGRTNQTRPPHQTAGSELTVNRGREGGDACDWLYGASMRFTHLCETYSFAQRALKSAHVLRARTLHCVYFFVHIKPRFKGRAW